MVSCSSPKGKQLWYSWHLSRLAFCNMVEQRKMPCLDNSRQEWVIGCPSHLVIRYVTRWWYHLIPSNFRKHHWSRSSILSTSLLVTAQHSEPYRKIGRMQVLYNFSLVGMVILDLQICLSRFCIAARVWQDLFQGCYTLSHAMSPTPICRQV